MTGNASHLRSIVNADGGVILNTRSGNVTTLNPTAAEVWQALQRGDDFDTVVTLLVSETGASRDIVLKDVHELLDSLKEHGLISDLILRRVP
jgi:hypothetical protein